jgi:hypothetical protein
MPQAASPTEQSPHAKLSRSTVQGTRATVSTSHNCDPDNAPILSRLLQGQASRLTPKAQHPCDKETVSPRRSSADLLRSIIISTVIPELVRHYRKLELSQPFLPFHPQAEELADLLVRSNQISALKLIRELHREIRSTPALYGQLFEPAARRLGDLLSEDRCTETDVALGLSHLQLAVSLFAALEEPYKPRAASQQTVLVAPEPGELHGLRAVLDHDVLLRAGWDAHVEWPTDDDALEALVASRWFDVLDLSLSPALRRCDWLRRVKTTIRRARLASRNPALLVLVGGRIFTETKHAAATVGADMRSRSAIHVDRLILGKMDQRCGR